MYNGINVQVSTFINIVAIVIGFILCFWGLRLFKTFSSIILAIVLGYAAYTFTFQIFHNTLLSLITAFIGLILGFVIGQVIYKIVISIALAYILISQFVDSAMLQIILSIVLSIILYIVIDYILVLTFVAAGGLIIYRSLIALGITHFPALMITFIVAILGLFNQLIKIRKKF